MSNSLFPNVLSPICLGSLKLRNRVVLTGHGTLMVKDGRVTDQLRAYYEERAKGGVGLIMVGTQQVHPSSPGLGHLLSNYDDNIIPELSTIVESVHKWGGAAFGYIGHFGAFAGPFPSPAWAPSAVYIRRWGSYSREMSEDDIHTITEAHAAAAERVKRAGMDGVEIHSGHGLLLNQFLSPLFNKRTDDYGGSLERRMRFPLEVLKAVRAAVGKDFPVGVRISCEELLPGGLTIGDMTQVAKAMVTAGSLDFIDASMGNDTDDVSDMLHHPPMGFQSAPYAHIAKQIRDVVPVPVIHGTRINSVSVAENLLTSGSADLAGMCRALIADPHLPNKAARGEVEEIIPCVACEQACIGHLERGQAISCVGNPITGRERSYAQMKPAGSRKKVLVVGGGPAGLETATIAARRGHLVELHEASSQLGGLLRTAARIPTRGNWLDLIESKIDAAFRAGVAIRLDSRLTADQILASDADSIVFACGSKVAPLPIADDKSLLLANEREVLDGDVVARGRVVVVDYLDYTSGIGVALYLLQQGYQVTVITESSFLARRLEKPTRAWMFKEFAKSGGLVVPDSRMTAVANGNIVLESTLTGMVSRISDIGTVVIAGVPLPNDVLPRKFPKKSDRVVFAVGDCLAPRTVEQAILEGHTAAWSI